MRLFVLLILNAFVLTAAAEQFPIRGTLDPRIRSAPYSADQVYRVKGFVGYQTDLEFEPGEAFVGLGAGDIEGIAFVAQDNHLFLKPKASRVGTNLTILTSRRTYHVDYAVSAGAPESNTDAIYVVRFIYPTSLAEANLEREKLALTANHSALNKDYWYCGNPSIRPIAASDDGVHTRLRFEARSEEPAVFVLNDDGSESLLNFSIDSGDVVIHRIARRFILRRGNLTGCIVNKGFAGTGKRLKSNTVSNQVERDTRGAQP